MSRIVAFCKKPPIKHLRVTILNSTAPARAYRILFPGVKGPASSEPSLSLGGSRSGGQPAGVDNPALHSSKEGASGGAEPRGVADEAEPSCTAQAKARTRVAILCNTELMQGCQPQELGLSTKSFALFEQYVATDGDDDGVDDDDDENGNNNVDDDEDDDDDDDG